MGKQKKKYKSDHASMERKLTSLGALIALVGYLWGCISSSLAVNLIGIVVNLVGVLISLILLKSTGVIKKKKAKEFFVPFTWLNLLIFIILQVVIQVRYLSFISLVGLGLLFEVIAEILLIIKKM